MRALFRPVPGIVSLFVILSAVFFSPLLQDVYQLPKAAGLAAAFLFFLPAAVISAKNKVFSPAEAAAFFLCLYFTVRFMLSENHPPLYYGLIFSAPFAFFVFSRGGFKPPAVSALLNLLFFASACFGIYQFSFQNIARPYSFFGNPIFFAEFCGSILPFVIYGLVFGGKLKYLSALNLVLAPVVLVICSSRGALISCIISLSLIFVFLFRSKIKLFPHWKFTAALLAGCLLFPLFVPGSFNSLKSTAARFNALSVSSSPEITNRIIMAGSSLGIFLDAPAFGMGPGAVRQLHQIKQAQLLKDNPALSFVNTSYTHNDYLQLLAETGAIGLLLFLIFVFLTAYSFERASAFMKEDTFLFSAAAMSAVLFFITESFFNFPLFAFPSCVLFYSFCGIIASCSAGKKTETPGIFVPAAAALLVLSLLFTAGLIKSKPAAFAANFYQKGAAVGDISNPYYLEKSLALTPDNFYALYYSAQNALTLGDTKTAFLLFKKIMNFFPNSADIFYNAGYALSLENRHKEAMEYYEKALFLYPSFSTALRGMYASLMSQNMEKEALVYLEKAVMSDSASGTDYLKNNGMILKEVTP